MFECEDYHSHFKIKEIERGEVLTDRFAIHFFELKKIKSASKKKPMEDWLNLINAETEGDLMDIEKTTTIPEVHKTIVILKNLSADEKIRQEAFYREKALHDEASAILGAKEEGKEEGKKEGKEEGIKALIISCKEDNVSYERTHDKLIRFMNLSDIEASKYMNKYWE